MCAALWLWLVACAINQLPLFPAPPEREKEEEEEGEERGEESGVCGEGVGGVRVRRDRQTRLKRDMDTMGEEEKGERGEQNNHRRRDVKQNGPEEKAKVCCCSTCSFVPSRPGGKVLGEFTGNQIFIVQPEESCLRLVLQYLL